MLPRLPKLWDVPVSAARRAPQGADIISQPRGRERGSAQGAHGLDIAALVERDLITL